MNIKQKVTITVLGVFVVVGVAASLSLTASAAPSCGGVDTAIIDCTQDGKGGLENTGIWGILLMAINILTALVGVAALAGIVYGSIMYASAGGNVEQTKKAMGIIMNVVIGVLAYAVMFSGLNFLIPGGIFRP